MENNINSPELQEMKLQVEILKRKLQEQTIVSNNMIRRAMSRNVSSINSYGRVSTFGTIALTPFCLSVFYLYGFSIGFLMATAFILLFSVYTTWKYHHELWKINPLDGDMLTMGRIVSRLHERYSNWLRIALPMFVCWFVWMAAECYVNRDSLQLLQYFLPGSFVGGAVGFFVGNKRRQKIVKQAADLLEQIKALQSGMEK